jgi:tRNA pseudouridine55 synthase
MGARRDRPAAGPAGDQAGALDGVLLIDKPPGITSHDVVARVRRALHGARTGHAGTLDPFATGLLLVLVGRATKSQRAMMALPKRYETVAQLGAISTTGDTEGEVTATGRLAPDPPRMPTGEVRQRPPIHSAVKIGGERAYALARRGVEVEMPLRRSTVYTLDVVARDVDTVTLDLRVSSGTYVRAIAHALGGHCTTLRRTAVGPFDIVDAVTPDAFTPERLLPEVAVLALVAEHRVAAAEATG